MGSKSSASAWSRLVFLWLKPEYRNHEQARVEVLLEEFRILIRDLPQAIAGSNDILKKHISRCVRFTSHGNSELSARGKRTLDA